MPACGAYSTPQAGNHRGQGKGEDLEMVGLISGETQSRFIVADRDQHPAQCEFVIQ